MKFSVLLALSIALSDAHIVGVSHEQHPLSQSDVSQYSDSDLPKSFLDYVYGDLIADEDDNVRVAELLNSGKVKPPVEDFAKPFDESFASLGYDELTANKMKHNAKIMRNAISYSQLKLPHKDYTDDIAHDMPYFGSLNTFANTKPLACYDPDTLAKSDSNTFDVAFVGAAFDTATSFRPGARFGPAQIRSTSKRLGGGYLPVRGMLNKYFNKDYASGALTGHPEGLLSNLDVYQYLNIVDCGDVPMSPFDNRIALNQLYRAERMVHKYKAPPLNTTKSEVQESVKHPKIITLGGDHTITLYTLKALYEVYKKPITVIHFDSHIDTWRPSVLGGSIHSGYSNINHGTFLHYAAEKGYLNAETSLHVGIRAPVQVGDMAHDEKCGFETIFAREIDIIGLQGMIDKIKQRIFSPTDGKIDPENPVFITFDIDVLDPVYAPATGTSEPGGFTIREILNIVDALEGINLVGADLVEVAPIYDSIAETTSLNAAQIIDSFVALIAAFKFYQTE